MIPFFDYRREYERYKTEFDAAFAKVMQSGFLILSEEVKSLEKEIAAMHGDNFYAVGLNSGTDAIYLALKALGIQAGDEVITVSNTAVPTVSAIRMAGAIPRFVDIDPNTLLMDVDLCEKSITPKTKVILAVHLFGNMLNVNRLKKICIEHKLFLIEDCAQAQFSKYDDMLAGSTGDIACYSFYPTKNLGAFGDGGLCLSTRFDWIEKIRSMRMYGFQDIPVAHQDGINSRLDEMQAAFLRVKLKHIDEHLHQKIEIAARYKNAFKNHSRIKIPDVDEKVFHTYHLFIIQILERDKVQAKLKELGIATGIHYKYPIHQMPFLNHLESCKTTLPHTEKACKELLSLPCFPGLQSSEQDFIIKKLLETV